MQKYISQSVYADNLKECINGFLEDSRNITRSSTVFWSFLETIEFAFGTAVNCMTYFCPNHLYISVRMLFLSAEVLAQLLSLTGLQILTKQPLKIPSEKFSKQCSFLLLIIFQRTRKILCLLLQF